MCYTVRVREISVYKSEAGGKYREHTKQNLENQKEEEKTECRVFFDVTSDTLKGMIIDEAIGLSAVIINETVGDKINKANAVINYLNDLNAPCLRLKRYTKNIINNS